MQLDTYIFNKYGVQINATLDKIIKTLNLPLPYIRLPLEGILVAMIRTGENNDDLAPVTTAINGIDQLIQQDISHLHLAIETILVDLLADVMADIGDPCPKCGGATEVYWSRLLGSNVDVMECTRCDWNKVL